MANVIAPPPGMNLTPDQVTDALWNHHCRSFQSGATREIVLDLGWKIHLGQNGVDELAKRMRFVLTLRRHLHVSDKDPCKLGH